MAISDFYTAGESRQWVKILTVDPRSRRIEGITRDQTTIQIAVYEIPLAFRWPKEGEWWLIGRGGREWFLSAPMQLPTATVPIEELDPGDTLLGGEGAKIVVQGDLVDSQGHGFLRLLTGLADADYGVASITGDGSRTQSTQVAHRLEREPTVVFAFSENLAYNVAAGGTHTNAYVSIGASHIDNVGWTETVYFSWLAIG